MEEPDASVSVVDSDPLCGIRELLPHADVPEVYLGTSMSWSDIERETKRKKLMKVNVQGLNLSRKADIEVRPYPACHGPLPPAVPCYHLSTHLTLTIACAMHSCTRTRRWPT